MVAVTDRLTGTGRSLSSPKWLLFIGFLARMNRNASDVVLLHASDYRGSELFDWEGQKSARHN